MARSSSALRAGRRDHGCESLRPRRPARHDARARQEQSASGIPLWPDDRPDDRNRQRGRPRPASHAGSRRTGEELFSVTGGFVSASAPDLVGDFGLANANVNFDLDQNGITLSGSGDFGPAPVSFEWKERNEKGEAETQLTAKARATPDLLNAFGLAARNFMQGEAAVELTASGPGGRNFTAITASVDLTHAQLDVAEFGWSKKYDAPPRARSVMAKAMKAQS